HAGIPRAAHLVLGDLHVARAIELVPGVVGRDPRRRLDRAGAGARHDERDVGGLGRLGQHQVAAAAEQPGQAGWRDAEGEGVVAAEQTHALLDARDVDEVARHELVAVEGALVACEAALILEPALDEIEAEPRQPPLRHAAEILDVDGFVGSHTCPFLLHEAGLRQPLTLPSLARWAPPSPAGERAEAAYFPLSPCGSGSG